MVQVVISAQGAGDAAEWLLIEFQGELESNTSDLSGLPLGQLSFKAPGVPVLVIGHHRLEGKEDKLKKPLAVMQQHTDGGYRIGTLIRKKLIFSKRPQPIISTSQ